MLHLYHLICHICIQPRQKVTCLKPLGKSLLLTVNGDCPLVCDRTVFLEYSIPNSILVDHREVCGPDPQQEHTKSVELWHLHSSGSGPVWVVKMIILEFVSVVMVSLQCAPACVSTESLFLEAGLCPLCGRYKWWGTKVKLTQIPSSQSCGEQETANMTHTKVSPKCAVYPLVK